MKPSGDEFGNQKKRKWELFLIKWRIRDWGWK
jgi:hypothetical protein